MLCNVCVKQYGSNDRNCVHNFLDKNNTVVMPQSPYSTDLAPCDYSLFTKRKISIKENRFVTIDDEKSKLKNHDGHTQKGISEVLQRLEEQCLREITLKGKKIRNI